MITSHEMHISLIEFLDEIEQQNERMRQEEQENILNALTELTAAIESLNTQINILTAQRVCLPSHTHKLRLVK